MSTLKKIFGKQTRGSVEDEPDRDDAELGHFPTILVHPINIRQYPYQRARDRSWGSYGPIDHSRPEIQGPQVILPAMIYQPPSARSPGTRKELPSPLLPINTITMTAAARTSYSDSEFSQHQIPVSPERYEDALKAIEQHSPRALANPGLLTLGDLRLHNGTERSDAERALLINKTGQSYVRTGTSVRDPNSEIPSDLTWSPPLSDHETQDADLVPHAYQDANAFGDRSLSAGFPREVPDAVDLPSSLPPASSSGSVSTNILNTSSPLGENLEHVIGTVYLPSGPSASSSGFKCSDPSAPFIDIEIPEGNVNSGSSSSMHSPSISRYSGFVLEDTGLRQMSEGEIQVELQATMDPLGEMTGSREHVLTLSQENSQASISMQFGDDDHSISEQQSLHLRTLGQRITGLGPGSSQTSSSMSADRLTRATWSREGKADLYKESSSASKLRSPTPPLLYDRRTRSSCILENSLSLAPSRPLRPAEEDWQTVSDTRLERYSFNNDTVDMRTGSSLADNSDSGDVSVIEPNTGGFRRLGVSQHPDLPRHHQAFVLMKDNRSGKTSNVPLQGIQEGRLYQHPAPIAGKHVNPFNSSPPAIRLQRDSNEIIRHSRTSAHQIFQRQMSVKSNSTGGFDKLIESYGSINDSRNGQDVANVRERAEDQDKQDSPSEQPPPESTTWLSTVSESAPGEHPSLPLRSGSFAKVTILNAKGNLTGTPKGTGAREVGSSLAGASSPLDQLPSSPGFPLAPETISPQTPRQQTEAHPLAKPELPSSFASRVHTPTRVQTRASPATFEASSNFTSGVQSPSDHNVSDQIFATPDASSIYSSRAQSLNAYHSAASDVQTRLTARARALNLEGLTKQRRRRSSSESNCNVMASPLTTKASALPSPDLKSHKKRNTMAGLLSNYSPFDDANSGNSQHQTTMRERAGHQAYTESDLTSVSTTSRSILHDGVVNSDVAAPVFVHPVYGSAHPAERPRQQRGCNQARPDKFQRPIARVGSPHLHRIPHTPVAEILERREQISKLWLPIFCVIPPCALIFGYGYADEIMRIQSGGEVDSFAEWSKMFAVFWALSATPVTIVVAVVCVLLGSSI